MVIQKTPPQPRKSPPLPKRPKRMALEQFLAWEDEDVCAEWVDGKVIYWMASGKHQDIADFFAALMRLFAEKHVLGIVRSAPFPVKLALRPSVREPDVLFVAKAHADRIKRAFLDGPPDIAVEVVSPESRQHDRRDKPYEYAQGGVREYWLIDPERNTADFYRLGEDGTYYSIPLDSDGNFHSDVLPGFWMKVDWLWQDTLPTVWDVLQQWGML